MVNSGIIESEADGVDENRDLARVSRSRSSRGSSRRSSLGGSARAAVTWGLGAGDNAFRHQRSMSGSSVDDEEALKWAALERLPTFDRMRTTVMESLEGRKEEVDLRTLSDAHLRRELVGRLFKDAGDDDGNAAFLSKLRRRIDRVGIALPTVEVRYENLNVEAKVRVGGRSLPSLTNAAANALEAFTSSLGIEVASKIKMTILHRVSGVIKPGRMTLLLGPPSSGKTTLLRALAGKLDPTLKVDGTVMYNGRRLDEFVPQKTCAYVSQNDVHTPQMTVRETLLYSAKSQNVGADTYDLLAELHKKEKDLSVKLDRDVDYYLKASALQDAASSIAAEYTMKILGLDICSEIFVGDEMLRGISGGQKKRVTTGEMLVGPMKTLFMDEISTGLDSSTTYQIVKYLANITHTLDTTMLISLLQPAPETYDLFDDVILLSEGQIAYHGPRESIVDFFESCGFRCPERKGEADFLQEVTSWKDQEQYWADKSRPYQFVPVRQFAEIFSKCREGLYMSKELGVPFAASEAYDRALSFEPFPLTVTEMVKINFGKEFLLFKRNGFIYIFKTVQISFAALLGMATYFRTNMPRDSVDDANVFAGAIFFSVGNFLFNGYAELSLMIIRLPVFYRQRDMLFFPAWCYSTANWLLSIPISLLEVLVWVIITYYSIGFAPSAARFFKQILIYFWMHQTASLLFRVLGGVCRSMVLSNTGGTFTLLLIFTLGGFIIRKQDIDPWWIWGYYCSPLTYAQNGASINEFLAPQWKKVVPGTTEALGVVYLKSVGIVPEEYWYWISVAALIGFTFLLYGLFTLSLTFLGPLGTPQVHLSEEQRAEAHANLTGEILPIMASKRSNSEKDSLTRTSSRTGRSSALRRSGLSMGRKDVDSPDGVGSIELHGRKSDGMVGGDKANDEIVAVRSRASESLKQQGRLSAAFSFQGRGSHVSDALSDDVNGVAGKRGMILPFKPLSISFEDVTYAVDMPAQMKAQGATEDKLQLLRGITGAFRPGLLTALVGVSGAGKTTLMDVLAGRKTGGYIGGDIRIAGFPKKQETFARISGYCEQTDIHSPQLTVHESLLFSAWLRLDQDISDDTKAQFVLEVMNLVELSPITDALVGLPGITGLSTEQRKRLTIAVELVANPSIIFMDEPTSGLDARAAAIVMRTVRNTVDTGRTVVCTIHQPSIDIFEAFDELLLLKRGGQAIYAGPLGHRSARLVQFFEAVPGVPKIKEGYNPATWMLDISSQGAESRLGVDFAEVYEKSSLYKKNKALVQELKTPAADTEDLHFPTPYSQPFWSQITSCLWKQNLTYWRSPSYNNVRLIFATSAALLFGTLFWQVGSRRDTQTGVASTSGSLVGAILFVGINSASTVQPVVSTERTVFYRERGAGMYAAGPYAIAQVLIELPYLFVMTIIYALITYSMLAFEWTATKFFWYLYFMFFSFAYFTYYGMMCVGITPNYQISAVVSSFFYQIWNLFSGYMITRRRAPVWVAWYFWASPTAWTLYGTVISQLGDVDTPMRLTEGSDFPPGQTVSGYVQNYFGFKKSFLGFAAAMHLVFTGFFALIFIFAIKYLNFQNR